MPRSWLPAVALPIIVGSLFAGACGSGSGPPPDYRGDPLCASAQATETGTVCELSVSMHGHTYRLSCDSSQGSCDCFRDGARTPGASGFGGAAPACTVDGFDLEWSDCCGTPE